MYVVTRICHTTYCYILKIIITFHWSCIHAIILKPFSQAFFFSLCESLIYFFDSSLLLSHNVFSNIYGLSSSLVVTLMKMMQVLNVTTKVTIYIKLKLCVSLSLRNQHNIQQNMKMTGLRFYSTSKFLHVRWQQYIWHLQLQHLKQFFRFPVIESTICTL